MSAVVGVAAKKSRIHFADVLTAQIASESIVKKETPEGEKKSRLTMSKGAKVTSLYAAASAAENA